MEMRIEVLVAVCMHAEVWRHIHGSSHGIMLANKLIAIGPEPVQGNLLLIMNVAANASQITM